MGRHLLTGHHPQPSTCKVCTQSGVGCSPWIQEEEPLLLERGPQRRSASQLCASRPDGHTAISKPRFSTFNSLTYTKELVGRKWPPTPVFLPGKSRGQGSLVGYNPWGRKESDVTWRLNSNNRIQRKVCNLCDYILLLIFNQLLTAATRSKRSF